MPFDTLPSNSSLKPTPFKAHVSDEELQHLLQLVKLSPIGPETYENQIADPKDFTSFGIQRKWLAEAKQRWENGYDWRKTEDRINRLPNYEVEIEDEGFKFNVHFAALFSKKSDAVPLLLLHGWPGSFLEFLGTYGWALNWQSRSIATFVLVVLVRFGRSLSTAILCLRQPHSR